MAHIVMKACYLQICMEYDCKTKYYGSVKKRALHSHQYDLSWTLGMSTISVRDGKKYIPRGTR